MSSFKRLDRLVNVLWVGVALLYLWRWEVFFNSDFSIVGLTALETLRSGTWFIFIPGTGYQGLLLCSTATALFYKLFGPAPWVLNLWPTLVFIALLPAFRYSVTLWHGARAASLACLVLLFSPPLFHHLVLRSHPNLGEVILLGCWLFILLHRQSPLQSMRARCFCIGLITGLGVYLAGQFLFFVAAAALSIASDTPKARVSGRATKALYFLIAVCAVLWLLGWELGPLRTDRLQATFTFVALALLLRVVQQTVLNASPPRFSGSLTLALGALVGYSPKLLFQWFGGTSMGRTQISGRVADVVQRMDWFSQGWAQSLFGITEPPWAIAGILAVSVLLLALGVLIDWRKRPLSPFLLLPLANGAACLAGSAFVSPSCVWYFVPAFAGASIVISKLFTLAWGSARSLAAVIAMVYFGYGAYVIGSDLLAVGPSAAHELTYMHVSKTSAARTLVQLAEANGFSSGYADYDFAYATTLLSNERVTVAPLQSSFLPWIATRAAAAKRFFTVTPASSQTYAAGQRLVTVSPLRDNPLLSRKRSALLTRPQKVVLDGREWDFLEWQQPISGSGE